MADNEQPPPSPDRPRGDDAKDFFAIPDGQEVSSTEAMSSGVDTLILKPDQGDERPQSVIDTLIRGPHDPDGTVVEKARVLEHVGRDFFEPVGSIIGEHATRVERVRALVRDLDSNYLRLLLVMEGLSLIAVVGIVSFITVPDGAMYVLMEFLVGISLLRYIRVSVDGLGTRRWIVGALVAVLSLLWAGMLFHRVAPEPMWYGAVGEIREELPLLWGPIVGHIVVAVGLVLHLPLRRRLRARRGLT